MTDWQQIRSEYEAGASQRSLAAKYGISQSAISQYAKSHGWLITQLITPHSDNLVDQALADLALHLTGDPAKAKLQLNQHKLFADSFSQYMKAKLLSSQDPELPNSIDWSIFTQDELDIIQPIWAQAEERQRGLQENITTIRRVG